jgi:hypothetical protein
VPVSGLADCDRSILLTRTVFAVLLSLRRSLPPGDLFRLIERVDASLLSRPTLPSTSTSKPSLPAPTSAGAVRGPVSRLFELFVKELGGEEERRLLWDFWYQDDRRREMGVEGLREGMEESVRRRFSAFIFFLSFRKERCADVQAGRSFAQDFGEKVAKVRKAQKSFAEDKELVFEAKVRSPISWVLPSFLSLFLFLWFSRASLTAHISQMVDEQIRLLVFQQTLEQENPDKKFVGLSINNTIRSCILGGLEKKAEKVRSDFKVPDKRCVLTFLLLFLFERRN